jgi:hypothetical protein
MIPYPFHLIWDLFNWRYYEDNILDDNYHVTTGRFDKAARKFKYRKYGEFAPPSKGQAIYKKNKIISYHRANDANAVSFMCILMANTDKNGVLHIQELTSKADLADMPEAVSKQLVDE